MPRRISVYPDEMGWNFWNLISTIGAFTIAVSFLVFIFNAVRNRTKGEEAGADPWDGRTLEWSIPSPPPAYNFAEEPVVRHRDDFWHTKYIEVPEKYPRRVLAGGANGHDGHSEHGHIHLPSPSYFPALAATGLPVMGYGVIYADTGASWPLIISGILILLLSLFGWVLEPSVDE